MIYTQTISPNLTTIGNAGWCLWFVEQDYGVPHLDASAEDAWNACHFPHPLEQPPNATVPVYWTYFDTGENMEFGHIAIWVPGRGIFSSPFDIAIGNQWFSSIQAVTDRINQIKGANSRYLGWSEDLAGVQIVKGDEMNDEAKKDIYRACLHREPENDTVWRGISNDPQQALIDIMGSKEWLGQNDVILKAFPAAQAQIVELKAQLANSSAIDPATKAEIDQTAQNVSWIRTLLDKIFK